MRRVPRGLVLGIVRCGELHELRGGLLRRRHHGDSLLRRRRPSARDHLHTQHLLHGLLCGLLHGHLRALPVHLMLGGLLFNRGRVGVFIGVHGLPGGLDVVVPSVLRQLCRGLVQRVGGLAVLFEVSGGYLRDEHGVCELDHRLRVLRCRQVRGRRRLDGVCGMLRGDLPIVHGAGLVQRDLPRRDLRHGDRRLVLGGRWMCQLRDGPVHGRCWGERVLQLPPRQLPSVNGQDGVLSMLRGAVISDGEDELHELCCWVLLIPGGLTVPSVPCGLLPTPCWRDLLRGVCGGQLVVRRPG